MENRRTDRRGPDRRERVERREHRPWVADLADRRSGFERRMEERRSGLDRRAARAQHPSGRLATLAGEFVTQQQTGFPTP